MQSIRSRFVPSISAGLLTSLLLAGIASAADLELEIRGVEEGKGRLMVALFEGEAAFRADDRFQAITLKARPGSMRVVFADLPEGQYSVSAFHDANDDGELNTNLLGVPAEPFGFSRDARGRFGPPSFEDMVFSIGGESLRQELTLQ